MDNNKNPEHYCHPKRAVNSGNARIRVQMQPISDR